LSFFELFLSQSQNNCPFLGSKKLEKAQISQPKKAQNSFLKQIGSKIFF